MDITTPAALAEIRRLNDEFRTTFRGGKIYLTHGVSSLLVEIVASALLQVTAFSEWTPELDPYGEHDYLSFDLCNREFVFVIQYWDLKLAGPSIDPADPRATKRVGILMLTRE
jgi:hypothetical protein